MNISKTCPYCGGRGYINQFENIDSGCRAWAKECIACNGTGSIQFQETNADRIRRMSDEELLNFMKKSMETAYMCKIMRTEPMFLTLQWLQQPAEEDT